MKGLFNMKTFRFKHFSLTVNWLLVLAFVVGVMISTDAIVTTCENIRTVAPWWHTAFTAVESLVFLTATVCCILKALQPYRPGRFRFYHTVALLACLVLLVRQAFFAYESLFLDDPRWLDWILKPLSLAGWCAILYCVWRLRHADKEKEPQKNS